MKKYYIRPKFKAGVEFEKEQTMEKVIDGLWNIKTTLLAVIVFVGGVIPPVIQVLTDLGNVLTQLGAVLSSGDPVLMLAGLWSLKAPIVALIASIGLLIARDWAGTPR